MKRRLLFLITLLSLILVGGFSNNISAKNTSNHEYLLVMGHGAGDSGAKGNGTSEATFLRKKMLPKLKKYANKLPNKNIKFYNPKHNIVKDTLVYHKGSYKIKKNTSVIMFHLDAPYGTG
ncbi:hypothetical protein [Lactobacillus sp. S2-2]|uniref:hypothetical protein n=1 Tax=Lactobacillus sp. S2-2 TaxID=2692917 RepID=UPI00351D37FC